MAKILKHAILHEDGSLTSKETAPDLPNVHVGDLVFEGLNKHGDKPLFADGPNGIVLTATQVKDLVTKFALGLLDLGVEQGDVVFGFCPNSSNYACMVLAILSIGATFTGCMYTYTKRELTFHSTDSGSKFLLCSVKNKDLAVEVADEVNAIKAVIIIDSEFDFKDSFTPCGKIIVPIQQLMNRKVRDSDPQIPLVIRKSPYECVAVIIYSSGSTGFPKGALRNHLSIIAATVGTPKGMHFFGSPGDIHICQSLIPHGIGTFTVIQCPVLGIKVVFHVGFQTETFLESVEKHKVSHVFLAPSSSVILSRSEDIIKKYDLSSLKSVVTSGAPLPLSVVPKFKSLIPVKRFYQNYGSTEVWLATCLPFEVDNPVTSGCPLPLHRMRVVDPSTGQVLGPNQLGEIQDQSNQLLLGYLNRPEADKQNFLEDKSGLWVKTGDAGYFDEDGLFYIVDRIKEVIKVDTFQVAPAELESILLSHKDVAEAIVIGIPDPDIQEVPKAFVVPKDKNKLPSTTDLINFVNERVVDYKKIRGGIQFIESIPKISIGKPDRVTVKRNPEVLKRL